jgi:arabinofuranosyltransferase
MFASNEARDPLGPGRFFWGPALAALLIVEIAVALAFSAEHRHTLIDDAFISFRYADRWAHGHGWTWNDGSNVEGFSNPLWTYTLGYIDRFLHIPPHQAALPLGLVAALLATLLVWGTLIRRGVSSRMCMLATGALALDAGLGVWSGSGLETSAAAVSVALVLFLSARPLTRWGQGFLLGVSAVVMTLVRPEGLFWGAWLGIWLVWGAWAPGRVLAGFALGWCPVLAIFVHRAAITGSVFSNTFFAKLEPSMLGAGEGLGQLAGWLLAHAAWLAMVLVLVLWRPKAREMAFSPGNWWFLPLGFLVGEALFLVVVGGDWMGRTRYLVPMLPALYLLGAEALRIRSVRLPVWSVLLVFVLHAGLGWMLRDRIETYTREGEVLGRWLAKTAAPTDTLATTASGAIPYFSGLPTIDVLGLNDPLVRFRPPHHRGAWAPGHHRYDIEHLLDQAPQWIVWDFGVTVNRHRMQSVRDAPPADASRLDYRRELFAHGKFIALYEVDTSAPPETQRSYTVFRRRE